MFILVICKNPEESAQNIVFISAVDRSIVEFPS